MDWQAFVGTLKRMTCGRSLLYKMVPFGVLMIRRPLLFRNQKGAVMWRTDPIGVVLGMRVSW